ncbi:hypothetical protein STA3757_35380 [Stanieria sp. NIES-3757]|nr:hypothetical protein STA3757_35380 [Stanieria sp. NIES-3757]
MCAYYGGGKTLELTQIDYVELLKREENIDLATLYHSLKRQLYKRIRKEQKKGINQGIKFTIASQRPNLPDINEQLALFCHFPKTFVISKVYNPYQQNDSLVIY